MTALLDVSAIYTLHKKSHKCASGFRHLSIPRHHSPVPNTGEQVHAFRISQEDEY